MQIEFNFQRGGRLTANLLPQAAQTVAAIGADLPIDARIYQARWSGREIFVPVRLRTKPPRENQSIRASLGDIIYFYEWGESYNYTGFEAIGLFYGPEIVREWRGDAPVNVIGRIDPAQHDLIVTLGDRIWREGGEGISIRLLAP